ncbi:MAG: GDP-L-fucose synthase [bacterium]|nr:GDP-L-fucose synthase [bacterium]
MNKDSLIYVAGHDGFIGSALVRKLKELNYTNILLKAKEELDLKNQKKVREFLKKEEPEYIFLAEEKSGGILANSTYPADFIYENITIQTNIIDSAYRAKVKKLLFIGSCCSYPKLCPQPMKEEYLLSGPLEPTNEAYAIAKIAGIKMCQSYNSQYGTNYIVAIPANLYGLNDSFDLRDSHVIPALLMRFHKAKLLGEDSITIWGSGKPRREFLYVDDFADACIFLMINYEENEIINVGIGEDISIAELADLIKEITSFKGKIIYDKTKPDGMPRKLLDVERINALGWKAKTSVKNGIKNTYEWYKKLKK